MKPILFNTEMVRAILDGRKTVTRRVVKPQPRAIYYDGKIYDDDGLYVFAENQNGGVEQIELPYRPGDILYVRETWATVDRFSHNFGDWWSEYIYCATYSPAPELDVPPVKWRPSIHMPREAARIFLRVTDVRVERLQHLGIEEALKEGITPTNRPGGCRCRFAFDGCMEEPCSNRTAYEIERHVEPFAQLWDSTIKPADRALYGWNANPWVWVIAFEKISKEEAMLA